MSTEFSSYKPPFGSFAMGVFLLLGAMICVFQHCAGMF